MAGWGGAPQEAASCRGGGDRPGRMAAGGLPAWAAALRGASRREGGRPGAGVRQGRTAVADLPGGGLRRGDLLSSITPLSKRMHCVLFGTHAWPRVKLLADDDYY